MWEFVLPVTPVSKKNSRDIFRNRKTGAVFLGKGKNLREFEQVVGFLLRQRKCLLGLREPLKIPLKIRFLFEMKNSLRLDPDNAMQGFLDCLQSSGVIENDKLFKEGSWKVVEYTKKPDQVIIQIEPLLNPVIS